MTGDINIINFAISFVLEACSGSMDELIRKNSSNEKHHLKHIGRFHKEKLENKYEDKSLNWKASVVRRLALESSLDASFFDYLLMDLTYYQHLCIKHLQNTYWTLPIDYNNRSYCWFSNSCQSSLLKPKHVFLLHIST